MWNVILSQLLCHLDKLIHVGVQLASLSAAQNMYIFDQVVADSCLEHSHVLRLSNIYSDDLSLFSPELRL